MNIMHEKTNVRPVGVYRPKLTFYHPNQKGTGCAVSMDLHPAHDDTDGSIMMKAANQMTIGDRRSANPTFPRFDWENALCVKLDFNDLCRFLQVFRGECESIDEDRGLLHRSPSGLTRIQLRHLLEPAGYSLELYRSHGGKDDEVRAHILFTGAEATGLCEAIAGSMSVIAFGMPMLVAHDTSAYVARTKEMSNVSAA